MELRSLQEIDVISCSLQCAVKHFIENHFYKLEGMDINYDILIRKTSNVT